MASYFPMVKNSAQRIVFPILDADGDPVTGAAADTPDSEYSLDGASFVDIADEIHEIATASGIYYLDLTAGETNGDVVCIQIKTATAGTKTTVLVFYTAAQSLNAIYDSIATRALEATLTAIKGVGWSTETLKAIKDAIDAIPAGGDATEAKQDAIEAKLDDGTTGLANLKALIDALEATLTAIKGAGWSNETLKLIKELVDELETGEKPEPKAKFEI